MPRAGLGRRVLLPGSGPCDAWRRSRILGLTFRHVSRRTAQMPRALNGLLNVYNIVEKVIVITLLVVLMVVVLWACGLYSFELIRLLVLRLFHGEIVTSGVVSITERMAILREVFGSFLLVLIGVELMKTIAMYLSSHEMHIEVVFTVAIIAIARHAIDMDPTHLDPMQLV